MSSIVKTATPFIDRQLLLEALNSLGIKYSIRGNTIVTERRDDFGQQTFIWQKNRYIFKYDSWRKRSVSSFLKAGETEYKRLYQKRLEEIRKKQEELRRKREELERKRLQAQIEAERKRLEEELKKQEAEKKRLEEERKAFVEAQKKNIIEKAKAKGYSVKEKKVGNKVKLILVRHTH